MRGRKPDDDSLKELMGRPGKRDRDTEAPELPEAEAVPQPPPHIKGPARTEWMRICAELKALGRLHVGIRPALVAYCAAYQVHRDALISINEHGATYKKKGYVKENPAVRQLAGAAATMRQLLVEFGLTPVSSQRVRSKKSKAADEFTAFMTGGGMKLAQ